MKWPLRDLDVVAAWTHDPPALSWRAIRVVLAPRSRTCAIWAVRIIGDQAEGFEEPWSSLEEAVSAKRATLLPKAIPAKPRHSLVWSEGTFQYVLDDELARRRRLALQGRLADALTAFERAVDLEEVADKFDAAYLVSPTDRIAAVLRAGAAAERCARDDAWYEQAVSDLEACVEESGDLVPIRDLEFWNDLPEPDLREKLYHQARAALDDHLRPRVKLEDPVPSSAIDVARALYRWRHQERNTHLKVSHSILVEALHGDPEATRQVDSLLEHDPTWRRLREHPEARDVVEALPLGRARIADMERFARTLYKLEQENNERDRNTDWRRFRQKMQGVERWEDNRPWHQGQLMAEAVRRQLHLNGEPIRSTAGCLAAHAGAFIGVMDLGAEHAAAAAPRNVPPCLFVEETDLNERRLSARFALAHQLAHLLADRRHDGKSAWVCATMSRTTSRRLPDAEKRANAFAMYFLAPRESVRELMKRSGVESSSILENDEVLLQASMDVRARFGLTPVQAAEHVLNCLDPNVSRDQLSPELRAKVESMAAERSMPDGFEEGTDVDDREHGPAGTRLRRGRFADLVQRLVAVGGLEPSRAASLLGISLSELESSLQRRGE